MVKMLSLLLFLGSCILCFSRYCVTELHKVTGRNWAGQMLFNSSVGGSISSLEFTGDEGEISRVRVYDPNNVRWEVPEEYFNSGYVLPGDDEKEYSNLVFAGVGEEFNVFVRRQSDGMKIFEIRELEMFEDQLIKFNIALGYSSVLDADNLFGLGEHSMNDLRLENNTTYTLFSKNHHFVYPGLNLYGSHPFVLQVMSDGTSNGFFLMSSNGMDVEVREHLLRFTVIGGIIDFRIFSGSTPKDVLLQYYKIIGYPRMIPRFALGYHQCKYGYKSVDKLNEVVEGYEQARIPLEAIWSDVDFMDGARTFTLGEKFQGMKEFVDKIHQKNITWVPIIDPGIKIEEGYHPYDEGIDKDVFIKNYTNDVPFLGAMFAGECYFPDFEHPNTAKYWQDMIAGFHDLTHFDACWLDQNELTSFCDGFCKDPFHSKYDNPPYRLGNRSISTLALSMSSRQHLSVHYNTHNLYAFEEAKATIEAIEKARGKRSFLVSRSSFPGLGRYGGHWLGDNNATWEDMRQSIVGSMNFNMFGIPFVGADVGGFYSNCSDNMMIRWLQMAMWQPFMRNHAHKSVPSQELYTFGDAVQRVAKKTILRRYSYHQYLYSTFYRFHKFGFPLVNAPLFIFYPSDPNCLRISNQFMVGDAVMVAPVLIDGDNINARVYLPPDDIWYDKNGLRMLYQNDWVAFDVPMEESLFFHRGGNVITKQIGERTLKSSSQSPFSLIVALNSSYAAEGFLYLDDGESVVVSSFSTVRFKVEEKRSMRQDCLTYIHLESSVESFGEEDFNEGGRKDIRVIKIWGIDKDIVKVLAGNRTLQNFKVNLDDHSFSLSVDRNVIFIHKELDLAFCYTTTLDFAFEIFFYCSIVVFVVLIVLLLFYLVFMYLRSRRKKELEKKKGIIRMAKGSKSGKKKQGSFKYFQKLDEMEQGHGEDIEDAGETLETKAFDELSETDEI